jgi:hypothetical protein
LIEGRKVEIDLGDEGEQFELFELFMIFMGNLRGQSNMLKVAVSRELEKDSPSLQYIEFVNVLLKRLPKMNEGKWVKLSIGT